MAIKWLYPTSISAPQMLGLFALLATRVSVAAPLFGPDSGVEPPLIGPSDPYCSAGGTDASSIWIDQVDFGRAVRPSGDNQGYLLTSLREQLTYLAYEEVVVRVVPGYGGEPQTIYWAIWVDADLDGSLEPAEQLLTLEGEGEVRGTMVIPEVASLTRMRVVMSSDPISSPCGDIDQGEVEDYWLLAPADPYCSVDSSAQDVWIDEIEIDTYESVTGPNGGYLRVSQEQIYHLPPQVSYTLTPGSTGSGAALDWRIVIDADGDEQLESEEIVLELTGVVGPQTGSFSISPIGPVTRMRVIVARSGEISTCGTLADGEVEDYWVTTAPPAPEWPDEASQDCSLILAVWESPVSKWGSTIASYNIWRDGRFTENQRSTANNWSANNWNTAIVPGAAYVVEVSAVDSDGFESPRSEPLVFRTPPCSTLASQGNVRVLVLLINLAGAPSEPFGKDYIRERWFDGELSAAAYYHEASFGVTNLTGDVFGWYSIDGIASDYCAQMGEDGMGIYCRPRPIVKDSLAVTESHIDPDAYDFVVGVVNGVRGGVNGGPIVVGATPFYSSRKVFVHELGHGFRLSHAGGWRCPGPGVASQIDDLRAEGCSMNAYWDDYDPMGGALRHFDAVNKVRLGFLSPEHLTFARAPAYQSELPLVQEFDLHPIELPGGDTYAVLVPLSHGNRAYYKVEYRIPIGFDAVDPDGLDGVSTLIAPPVFQGLMIRLQREEEYQIDGYHIPVTVDESNSFDDPYRRIRIEALELGDTARARITHYAPSELGDACLWDPSCASGHCMDGYCCDTACTGQCEACDEPGHEGECIVVEGAPRGERPACEDPDGTCDGATWDACVNPPVPPSPSAATEGCASCASTQRVPASSVAWVLLMILRLRRRHWRRSPSEAIHGVGAGPHLPPDAVALRLQPEGGFDPSRGQE